MNRPTVPVLRTPRLPLALVATVALTTTTSSQADILDWLVVGDFPWTTRTAWEDNSVPGPGDIARYPSLGAAWTCRINIDPAIDGLQLLDPNGTVLVESGRTLTILDDPADVNGILAIVDGTMRVAGGHLVVDDSINGGGRIDNDGTISLSSTTSITAPQVINDGLLRVEGIVGLNTTLAMDADVINRGTFELESTGNGFAQVSAASGTVLNEATGEVLFSGGGSQPLRQWHRDLESFGSVRVAAGAQVRFNAAGTTVRLAGGDLITESTGQIANSGVANRFEFVDVTVDNQGMIDLSNASVEMQSATLGGAPIHLSSGDLTFGPGATVTGSILADTSIDIFGDVPAETLLQLRGRPGLNTTGTFDGSTIAGEVRMSSDGNGFSQLVSADPVTVDGTLSMLGGGSQPQRLLRSDVDVDGTLLVGAGADARFDDAATTLRSTGTVEIEAGGSLVAPISQSLVIDGGSVVVDGSLTWTSGSVDWNAGTISGTPWELSSTHLTIGPGVSGPATFLLPNSARLTGDLPADVTVRIEGRPGLNGTTSLDGDVQVVGRLDLLSTGNGFAQIRSIDTAARTVTVKSEGEFMLLAGGSQPQRLVRTSVINEGQFGVQSTVNAQFDQTDASLIQRGQMVIEPGATFIGGPNTLRLEDGAIVNDGILRWSGSAGRVEIAGGDLVGEPIDLANTTLAFAPGTGSLGSGTMWGTGVIEGDVPATFPVRIEGRPGLNTVVTMDAGATLDGLMELVSTGNGFAQLSGPTGDLDPIVNRGTIDMLPGGSQPARILALDLVNEGTMRIVPGATVQNARTIENVGRFIVDGPFRQTGASGVDLFNLAGGTLEGVGPIGASNTVVHTAGVTSPGEDSTATMAITGSWDQMPEGSLRIELGGDDPATQQDRLVINGEAHLAGGLDVVLVDGFSPPVGASFVVLEAAGGLTGGFEFLSCPNAFTISQTATEVIVTIAAIAVPGDVNCDGVVDFTDLLSILTAYGVCPDCPQDLDGDGEVGFSDVLAVLSAWT